MNATFDDLRNDFGFPSLLSFFQRDPVPEPKQPEPNYRVVDANGDEEDYSDQLGIGAAS